MVNLGDELPNFPMETTHGSFMFHDWLGGSWAFLFAHPADFTPVCTTELGCMSQLVPEFTKRGVKLIALSCDDVESHKAWIKDVQDFACTQGDFPYPIISDKSRDIAVKLGMVDAKSKDAEGMPLTCRAVFIIGPEGTLRLSMLYPATTGRNFREILRVIDALQLTDRRQVATPAGWQPGEECLVQPFVKDEELAQLFPEGVTTKALPSGKKYLRMTLPK